MKLTSVLALLCLVQCFVIAAIGIISDLHSWPSKETWFGLAMMDVTYTPLFLIACGVLAGMEPDPKKKGGNQ